MGYNQPMQSNQQKQFVQIPLKIEHGPTTPINQTIDLNRRSNKWLTIIICIILAVTGQSIARLLENYYFLNRNRRLRFSVWTQSLLQVVGFPLLFFPFLLNIFSSKKPKILLITSNEITFKYLAIAYPIIGSYMFLQAFFSNFKYRLPFKVFTLIYTTQLLFTPIIFSIFYNKIKFNRWMVISLFLASLAGAFTLFTFSAGSPIYEVKIHNINFMYVALSAAVIFSFLLCQIRNIFEVLISICNTSSAKRLQPSFAVVFESLIFTSLIATIILVTAVFIFGEHRNFKGEMDGFSKGEIAYVRTMVGQAAAWQIYWVGIVGLVFAVSAMFANVISVCTWPIVSLLVAFLYNTYDQFDVFRGIALGAAALSVASYIYLIHKEKSDSVETTT